MEASCIRRDNDKKHVYHLLVKSAILEVPLTFRLSWITRTMSGSIAVARLSQGIPAQALHLARSPGRELLVGCALSQPSSSIGGAS
jgi:hypothetical protein